MISTSSSKLEINHYLGNGISLSDPDCVRSLAMYVGTKALKYYHLVPQGIQRERLSGFLGAMLEPAKVWNANPGNTPAWFSLCSRYEITQEKMRLLRDYIITSPFYVIVSDDLCIDNGSIRNVHWMVLKKTDKRMNALAGEKINALIQESNSVEIKFNAVSQHSWNLVNHYCKYPVTSNSNCCIQ